MKITKIILRALPSTQNQQVPADLELEANQSGLIPGIGDRYMGPGFSMDVTRRKFEVHDDVMWVFLENS